MHTFATQEPGENIQWETRITGVLVDPCQTSCHVQQKNLNPIRPAPSRLTPCSISPRTLHHPASQRHILATLQLKKLTMYILEDNWQTQLCKERRIGKSGDRIGCRLTVGSTKQLYATVPACASKCIVEKAANPRPKNPNPSRINRMDTMCIWWRFKLKEAPMYTTHSFQNKSRKIRNLLLNAGVND
jgi:hypothetical protein